MPELPDISLYIEALRERIDGRRLERARVVSPFLLRSVEPPVDEALGRRVVDFRRLGKRIAIGFENDLWFVIHLMIAGRFQWRPTWPDKPNRLVALLLGFDSGVLLLTEAGTKKRASLYVVRGEQRLAEHNPGGLELADTTQREFLAALRSGNHTLKRALTDPRLLSGIGNAYSDEILHRARLSPVTLTSRLSDEEGARLYRATLEVLAEWTERLRRESAGEFPSKVTAFHAEMAVHGRYRLPCPVCGTKVQRIRYADNETNYCPRCQTGGKLLADRSLSRLLKSDWPKSIDELEQLRSEARP
ncbi:MAG TPA: DNA-formamidopyrimidine glycosylase family protein [Gammaproteobacteria bacterium]|nr:DNA-formamidopyrimidine glycosylase family protein [Gammaproteobacteria bacterium]